jgi:hypothetical protein
MANLWGGKKGKKSKLSDWIPQWGGRRKVSAAELDAKMAAIAGAING